MATAALARRAGFGLLADERLPALAFVTLYGAGFVGARLGLPHAGPLAFLALRFALAAVLLAALARAFRAPWPARQALPAIVLAGLLTVGVFSVGVFVSIAGGVPPAVSALIIALHPVLVATLAPGLLGERVAPRRWTGLLLGLAGVFLVLRDGLASGAAPGWAVAASFAGLAGLSAGNLLQKAHCAAMHPFAGGAVQCAACAVACALGWLAFEPTPVRWTGEFVVALLWMAVVVSVGAVSLLVVLIRRDAVSRVAGLFYLVPVSAALAAWLLFDQGIAPLQWLGIAVAATGVTLAIRNPE
ncbi:DMT family transporter [Dechloromonas sp. H13]|uniref:DMT family transporter n=1 Tax=Dechloromonas sp. H13 TaxID=2570193 RepID=UPI0012909590|nr:DMT family transporter [Dechloromonas sp. H13]